MGSRTWDAQVDDGPTGAAAGFISLAAQEGESEVDTFDLTDPTFGFSVLPPVEEVLLKLVQAGQHLRVDIQHRAADAGFSELREPVSPCVGICPSNLVSETSGSTGTIIGCVELMS